MSRESFEHSVVLDLSSRGMALALRRGGLLQRRVRRRRVLLGIHLDCRPGPQRLFHLYHLLIPRDERNENGLLDRRTGQLDSQDSCFASHFNKPKDMIARDIVPMMMYNHPCLTAGRSVK
jgi:hypothetical protein